VSKATALRDKASEWAGKTALTPSGRSRPPGWLAGLAARAGVSQATMCERLKRMSPEEAVALGKIQPRDLTGLVFGRLTVLERVGTPGRGWRCRCSCSAQRVVEIKTGQLTGGKTRSCGCLQPEAAAARRRKLTDSIIGQQFGELTVVSRTQEKEGSHDLFLCSCACGGTIMVTSGHLRSGGVKSCGCLMNSTACAARSRESAKAWQVRVELAGEMVTLDDLARLTGTNKATIRRRVERFGMSYLDAAMMKPRRVRRRETTPRKQAPHRCRSCGRVGHNARSCPTASHLTNVASVGGRTDE